jgi:peroxiredoxin
MNSTKQQHDTVRPNDAGGKQTLRTAASGRPGSLAPHPTRPRQRQARRRLSLGVKGGIVAVLAVLVLGGIFYANSTSGSSLGGAYHYDVASPGVGAVAPPIRLQATNGSSFDLASLRGQSVLLFFQEGIGCEPCWTQMQDMQKTMSQFRALGISRVAMITTDDKGALRQKVADEGITVPVLSDPGFSVSVKYHANQYGMMGNSADGHTFILVGKDGKIQWRADYGGAPNYTMYVPVPNLLADLRVGIKSAPGGASS